METADEFVDNVLTAACRLAKLRADQTLDIRDIQVVLERNYNIRIPGYSLDESRVVRRVLPSPSWHQKMSAINAAKVMSGKSDS
jgi:transcription initiation factor TFIID subunit TAF12